MADGDEEKEIVAVVGGDENQWSPPPPGFRFSPTDDELIEYYLLPRLQGRPHVPNDAIIEDYVYRCHPDDLILKGEHKDRGQDDVWYFLSSRSRKYGKGDRPSRMTEDGRGRWKATTGSKSVVTACQGVQYTHSGLGYHDGPIKEEDKGKWLMHELTVPEYENKFGKKNGADRSGRDTLDEYVMCKIYITTRETKKEKKRKKKRDEAGPSGTASQPGPAAAECSQETAPEPNVSERQKGKRPVVENTKKRRRVEAARPKQEPPAPDRCLGPQPQGGPTPTQFYGGATQMRFGNTGYQHHYGGTGRPMAYNPHASMPRPPMAFNGQVPPYQAAASPGVFGQAMMMPHMPPAGQAFRPPRPAAVPGYPAMQRPPETAEMRERRVYQQHINALRRMMQQQLGNAAYAAHQPRPTMAFMQHQQQQPYFGAGFNDHHLVRPMAPQFLPCNYHQPVEEVGQQVQYSYSVQDSGAVAATPAETEAGSIGAIDEVADVGGDCNNDEDKGSVEVVTKKALPDGGTAPTDGDDTEEDSTSQ
uniref:Uncharacterized protein n=1 Tax=Avena sativa TaxID=4498 RepID=A0ACD5UT87_AVESA